MRVATSSNAAFIAVVARRFAWRPAMRTSTRPRVPAGKSPGLRGASRPKKQDVRARQLGAPQAEGVTTCVPLAIPIALSLAAPPITAPTVTAPRETPPAPTPMTAPWVEPPGEDLPSDTDVPRADVPPDATVWPTRPPSDAPWAGEPLEEVSLGAGWTGSQANVTPRRAGARVAISPDDVALWTPPPAWAPPPFATDRYEGSEQWREIHLGLALGVVGILTAVGLGLTLSQDPDPIDDGRLPPATQFDASFPR